MRIRNALLLLITVPALVYSGERTLTSLKDYSEVEVRSAGFTLDHDASFHIKALGGGGDYGWTYKTDRMYAYGWIINATTRELVWRMKPDNTSRSHDDREFDGTVELPAGAYEVYFAAWGYTQHSAFSHFSINIDHRQKQLFGNFKEKKPGFFNWLTQWWSEDVAKDWQKRSKTWGIELLLDEKSDVHVEQFKAPLAGKPVVLKAVGLGDNAKITQAFTLSGETSLEIRAIGERASDRDPSDYGWIVNADTRERVWEMAGHTPDNVGGATKNFAVNETVKLDEGTYVVYFVTDDSHSTDDWNDEPPYDPYNWGITLSITDPGELKNFKPVPYSEYQNVIVSLVKARDNSQQSEGFTLKQETRLRVYAIGERSNARRLMADYGFIMDAKNRSRVWTMDVDRTSHAGGASKNRLLDEVITLPAGSYVVSYVTDDSHGYGDWNDDPPADEEHYGITIMGVGAKFNMSVVGKYTEKRDPNIIAQIVRVGDDVDRTEKFSLDKTTKVRIYALGEGQSREMVDYGWIEDAKKGNVVWEMTYGMTFHAGGARKNRMVNMTFVLDKGQYVLRYRSDDSHSYDNWNTDPPEDAEYWGITLFRDDGTEIPHIPGRAGHPAPSIPPTPPAEEDEE